MQATLEPEVAIDARRAQAMHGYNVYWASHFTEEQIERETNSLS